MFSAIRQVALHKYCYCLTLLSFLFGHYMLLIQLNNMYYFPVVGWL